MKRCSQLQSFEYWKNGGEKGDELPQSVREHLAECSECRNRVSTWDSVESELKSLMAYEDTAEESERIAAAESLIAQVRHRQPMPHNEWFMRPIVVGFAVAAAVVMVGALGYISLVGEKDASPNGAPLTGVSVAYIGTDASEVHSITTPGYRISTPDNRRAMLRINRDTVGIAAAGNVEITRVQNDDVLLSLVSGKIACKVAKRKDGGHFSVQSGNVRVVVIGTRFSVAANHSEKTIAVLEGVVQVEVGDQSWRVRRGQGLSVRADGTVQRIRMSANDAADMEQLLVVHPRTLVSEEARKTNHGVTASALEETEEIVDSTGSPSDRRHAREKGKGYSTTLEVDAVRRAILDGQLDSARKTLKQHLKNVPNDKQAWGLLADCERKSQNWQASVASYHKVMSLSSGAQYRRAAYRAASILQEQLGQHRKAVALLQKYLSAAPKGDPMRAEALIRQAQSHIQLGERDTANRLLDRVAAEYVGTSAAARARKLRQVR